MRYGKWFFKVFNADRKDRLDFKLET